MSMSDPMPKVPVENPRSTKSSKATKCSKSSEEESSSMSMNGEETLKR